VDRAQDEPDDLERRRAVPARTGFARRSRDYPELNADRHVSTNVRDQLAPSRGRGARHGHPGGSELQLQDRGSSRWRAAWSVRPLSGEIDTRDPKALHYIRSRVDIPCLVRVPLGRRDYRPYFEQQSVDVAIVDTP